ncbi:disease resistance protein [Trifolium medium]|uniref:Disease resistance protein n=1 Tax=Trifolium medium TaxID=97028 RepID=A0A392N235_9FABA|nr:disease resistance protein [Trifolium medium]
MAAYTCQENIDNLDIEPLQSRLQYKLSGKKFLLVLDDIWNDNRAKWLQLKELLKGGAIGSKIIVTTRSNSIASMMGDIPSYLLKGLSQEICLSLFVKWAFKEGEGEKYPNLVEIGKEIVKKCKGVPLAVRSLGSSLFSNFDVRGVCSSTVGFYLKIGSRKLDFLLPPARGMEQVAPGVMLVRVCGL